MEPMMNKFKEVRNFLAENNSEAMMIHPEEVDEALIGVARVLRSGDWRFVAMYSYDSLVQHFTKEFSKDTNSENEAEEMAMEWVDYNIVGAYFGPNTPMIINGYDL
jgi:hypothetical protein